MYTWIILILLFLKAALPTTSFAYQYSYFNSKKVQLSHESFNRYIRPQTKNIIAEFYHILKKINPLQEKIVQIKNHTQHINEIWDSLVTHCLRPRKSCPKKLQVLYKKLRGLELQLLGAEAQDIQFASINTNDISIYQLDLLLNLKNKLNQVKALNYEVLHSLEEYLIGHRVPLFERYPRQLGMIKSKLSKMQLSLEFMMTEQMDKINRREFYTLYRHYIRPLEKYIIKEKNKEYFLKRLGEFNSAWNSFHMKMAKGHHILPKNLRHIITIMHNRWNSLLKLLLKR